MSDLRQRDPQARRIPPLAEPIPVPEPLAPPPQCQIPPPDPPAMTRIGRWYRRSYLPVRATLLMLVLALFGGCASFAVFGSPIAHLSWLLSSEDRRGGAPTPVGRTSWKSLREELGEREVYGHGDFGDGRRRMCKEEFAVPESQALGWVNVNLGNGGPEPNLSGGMSAQVLHGIVPGSQLTKTTGMIPAVTPPFGMTRWSPQTRSNYVSMCPYNQTDTRLWGFIATHQPAIWMGESAPFEVSPGLGTSTAEYDERRGLPFKREDEYASANYYRNVMDAGEDGSIEVEMTATSRVGHLRFTFNSSGAAPYINLHTSRDTWVLHGDQPDAKVAYNPEGAVQVDEDRQEVYGWNNERQDSVLVGDDLPASSFKGYYVARFSHVWKNAGVWKDQKLTRGELSAEGMSLSAWVEFDEKVKDVEVRVGVSFISIEQARRNIDLEIPNAQTFAQTSKLTRTAWADKLDRLSVSGATPQNLTVLYTSYAHTLVYPYEISENVSPSLSSSSPEWAYYSGYLDKVVEGFSYSGYSIWDTFRAQTAWLLLVAPERVGGMITSMLQDYREGGWLPMWKNIVETNIMVGTHADSIIAQAMRAGVTDFDYGLSWEAVRKDAFVPPDKDTELQFGDREEHTPQEARAGLTEYSTLGYVADDLHTESGSRTLDYAYDDHAVAIVGAYVNGNTSEIAFLRERAKSYQNIWNAETGFMEARNSSGVWAGEDKGWTEGDHWAYSLDVMHDVPGLIELMGGNDKFVQFMDRHFEGGHNLHTNEPSHHIPYMYILAGAPHKTQEWVRRIGQSDYNHTAGGLSGNEDCGQMSAWYIFSSLGFYPLDPANATYILGAPFFEQVTLRLPNATRPLVISAEGASEGRIYVGGVRVDGQDVGVEVGHGLVAEGGEWVWSMEETPQEWGK